MRELSDFFSQTVFFTTIIHITSKRYITQDSEEKRSPDDSEDRREELDFDGLIVSVEFDSLGVQTSMK